MSDVKKQVSIAGVKQNCYLIGTSGGVVATTRKPVQKTYDILERKTMPNGYMEKVETYDYPITSDSVTSYAAGADYRNDPMQAIANAPKRVNLGDITQAQAFLDNPQNLKHILGAVQNKLADYYAKEKAAATAAGKETSVENAAEKEVN